MTVIYRRPFFKTMLLIVKGLKFLSLTLFERVINGSISLRGKVEETQSPFLVMPLTVEPSKPGSAMMNAT